MIPFERGVPLVSPVSPGHLRNLNIIRLAIPHNIAEVRVYACARAKMGPLSMEGAMLTDMYGPLSYLVTRHPSNFSAFRPVVCEIFKPRLHERT